ncbi:MAG: phospholipase D-like domain-containing protein [Candidatus Wallbacteria bacterium]|nr:phospholipase D-like domain-containing protein [Candidatus Wallbacteria bacterium]
MGIIYSGNLNVLNRFLIFMLAACFCFSSQAAVPVRPNTPVFNKQYPEVLISLINQASKSIIAGQYSFSSKGELNQRIIDSLIKAHQRGVEISIFLEGDKKGVCENNIQTKAILEKSGIKVFSDSSKRISHAKCCVFDGKFVLAGSTNLTTTSMTKNNESNLFLESEKIGKALAGYLDSLIRDSSMDVNVQAGDSDELMITDRLFFEQALKIIESAKKEICVATYLFAYPVDKPESHTARLFQALSAAAKRGVAVRVVLEQSALSFNRDINEANLKSSEFLQKQGITEIRFDDPQVISHDKIIITDKSTALLGSTNWYSVDIDSAHQVNFVEKKPEIVKSIQEYFDQQFGCAGKK